MDPKFNEQCADAAIAIHGQRLKEMLAALLEARNALKCARQQLAGSKPLSGVHASSLRADLAIVDQAIRTTDKAIAKATGA